MKRNILTFGCIISCLILIFSLPSINGIFNEEYYNLNNGNPRIFIFRFYIGEAHGYYIDENGSGFETYNCLEIRIWKYWDMYDNDSGIKFLHNKGNYSFNFGYGWQFKGIMREGFVCGFYYVYFEFPQSNRSIR